jgi:hypothetical protein
MTSTTFPGQPSPPLAGFVDVIRISSKLHGDVRHVLTRSTRDDDQERDGHASVQFVELLGVFAQSERSVSCGKSTPFPEHFDINAPFLIIRLVI